MRFSVFLLVSLLLFNCKEEKEQNLDSQDNIEIAEEPKGDDKFKFDFDFETSVPDDFSITANDVFMNNNQFMNVKVTHKLNANETQKKIRFEFPENIVPDYQLMLSLGMKNEKKVTVKSILLTYNETEFNVTPDKVEEYFTLNKFVEYNPESGILTTKKVEGNHNPLLFVRKKILDSISSAK
ncbi:MAG TPA: hypothetical protein VKZ97_09125 [Flavobacteriaceae bacterium]|nr:hypothetical protein [Flavobacteriaceae bacterium]